MTKLLTNCDLTTISPMTLVSKLWVEHTLVKKELLCQTSFLSTRQMFLFQNKTKAIRYQKLRTTWLYGSVTTECRFTLKHVHDMIITYNQMHCTNKYSQNNSMIWLVWLNGWEFIFELSGSESHRSHLIFRYCACFM